MATIYTNQWNARLVTCEQHAAKRLQYLSGNVRIAGQTDEECPDCCTIRVLAEQPAKMRAALTSPHLSHTRFRYGAVHAYHRDATSPSGVFLVASIDEARYAELERELAGVVPSGSLSPLSPTEGLCAPSQGRW